MNTTVNVLCYKSKTLKNGEHPLMICITKSGKRIYKSLGMSINPKFWDFNRNKPKRNYPYKYELEQLILSKKEEVTKAVIELDVSKKDYSVSSVKKHIENPIKRKTIDQVINEHISFLIKSKRKRYADTFTTLYNSLIDYTKNLDIYFSEIDLKWLKDYENWLRANNLAENTIGTRFRSLRVIYNIAMNDNHVKHECYPFKKFKVSKLHQATAKRAITKDQIDNVINYKSSNASIQFSIDVFTFSYLMAGINFVDISTLTKDNISDNRLIYNRKKTGKLIKLPLHPNASLLIDKYYSRESKYLFPILSSFHKTDQQKAYRIDKALKRINKHLKIIGKELKLPIDLTTYVARHSFATVLKRSGVSTSIISETLGHSSEKVTQIYLDSFDNEQINVAMKNLL